MIFYDQPTYINNNEVVQTVESLKKSNRSLVSAGNNKAIVPFRTDPISERNDSQLKRAEILPTNTENASSDIIAQSEVEVIKIDENYVLFKLQSRILKFNRVFFPSNNIRFGQHFLYQIRKNSQGLRYQHFEPIKIKTPESDKEEILKILSQF